MSINRRCFLASAFALSPIAAVLASCGRSERWPEGMQPIMWDRDTCVVCNMAIAERRFAGEMRGGPKNTVFKFDDPGCIALWLNDKSIQFPWIKEATTRIWVADVDSRGGDTQWLDARTARYVAKFSPMGYNFGAIAHHQADAVDFPTMCEKVVAKVRKLKA